MRKIVISIAAALLLSGLLSNDAEAAEVKPANPQEAWIFEYVDSNIELGDIYKSGGYLLQANFHYNMAYVALASFRYSVQYIGKMRSEEQQKEVQTTPNTLSESDKKALDSFDGGGLSSMLEGLLGMANSIQKGAELFEEKAEKFATAVGVDLEADKEAPLSDQLDNYARISIASPFTYLFEGYIREFQGKNKDAALSYIYALANPWMPEDAPLFYDIYELPLDQLKACRARLVSKESSIAHKMKFEGPTLDRGGANWLFTYHAAMAVLAKGGSESVLKKLESSDQAALKYITAAVYAYPFDVNLFAYGAELAKNAGNHEMYQWFLREGMILDPENDKLKPLFKSWEK